MTPDPPTIRRATAADLDRLAGLERRAFDDPWSSAALVGELDRPEGRCWLAEREGEVVAYSAFLVVAGEAELLRVAVDPAERRQGVARGLLRRAFEALAESDGVERCHLEVRADNAAAIALYRRLGFRQSGRRRGYYGDGEDALLFVLEPLA